MRRYLLKSLGIALIAALAAAPAWAYQEMEVKNGGSIQGIAKLTNGIPSPRFYHLILFPNVDMCAEVDTDTEMNRYLKDFEVDENMGLKDVVITIEHMEAGKPFPQETLALKSESCKFLPLVNVIRQGGNFTVNNIDAVMHNSQVYQSERGKIILNIPIPAEEVSNGAVTFQKDYKIFQMICGMHEFMQTWGYRIENPYNFITKDNGKFKIDQIPPGDYTITAWHYLMKPRSKKVHIEANATVDLNFEFDGHEVERPLYETIKSGRIKKDAAAPGTAKHHEAKENMEKMKK